MQKASKSCLIRYVFGKLPQNVEHTRGEAVHAVAVVIAILPTRYDTDLVINHYIKSLIHSLTAFIIGRCLRKRLPAIHLHREKFASVKCLASVSIVTRPSVEPSMACCSISCQ